MLVGPAWELSRERRWQLAVAAAGLAVLVAGVLVVVVEDDERSGGENSAQREGTVASTTMPLPSSTVPGTTTVTSTPPTSASTTAPPTTSAATTTTTGTTTGTTRTPATTTATIACRNSTNPACGPLVWDPLPAANQPMTVSFAYEPQPARIGQTVVFRIVVDDPDAPVSNCVTLERFGDGSPAATCAPSPCPPQYGPWTPAARPGHLERTFQHIYTRPGTYVASFGFTSESCGASMIFGNAGSIDVNVVVGP